MNYAIERVPTFLLHDGISWCRKNNRARVRFFLSVNGIREDIIVTPDIILAEIIRRQNEPKNPLIHCASCGAEADGRCYFVLQEPLCEPCYWTVLKSMRDGTPQPIAGSPRRDNVIEMPVKGLPPVSVPSEETPEQIAARLGVSLDVLQASGYFD